MLNRLRHFVNICAYGNISKAAENLHISQQGLSSSLRRLEEEFGCDLFYRKSGSLVLTDAGKVLREQAIEILRKVDNLQSMLDAASGKSQIVTVACTLSIIARLPHKLQQLLLDRNTDCRVKLTEGWTSECEAMVSSGEATFAITPGTCDKDEFDCFTIDNLQRCFIVNNHSPLAELEEISLDMLDGIPLIIPPSQCRLGQSIRQMFLSADVNLNEFYNYNRPDLAINLVSGNPDLVAQVFIEDLNSSDLKHIKLLRLKNDPFLIPIRLISKKSSPLNVHDKIFYYMVKEFCQ